MVSHMTGTLLTYRHIDTGSSVTPSGGFAGNGYVQMTKCHMYDTATKQTSTVDDGPGCVGAQSEGVPAPNFLCMKPEKCGESQRVLKR